MSKMYQYKIKVRAPSGNIKLVTVKAPNKFAAEQAAKKAVR